MALTLALSLHKSANPPEVDERPPVLEVWQRDVDSLLEPPPEGVVDEPRVVGGRQHHHHVPTLLHTFILDRSISAIFKPSTLYFVTMMVRHQVLLTLIWFVPLSAQFCLGS